MKELIAISSTASIYDLAQTYPEISQIMAEIGFTDITKPMMLATAGRYMNLEKGAKLKGINWNELVEYFASKGFEVIK